MTAGPLTDDPTRSTSAAAPRCGACRATSALALAAGVVLWAALPGSARADDIGLSLPPAARMDLANPGRVRPDRVKFDAVNVDPTRPLQLVDTIGNPAEQMHAPQSAQSQPADIELNHPWLMPPVTVTGRAAPALREDQLIGTYAQPVWTADRRFSEVRVYVQPEGSIDAEFWVIPTVNRHGRSEILTQYEVEIGFPNRIQLDLYLINRFEGSGGPTFTDESIEFRYAFANWNEIPGNPTYYIELIHQDQGPDQIEQKLLFGGDFGPRLPGWHWGWDLTFQHSFGEDFENTYETTAGVSYALVDNKFDVGAEFKLQENTFHGDRRHYHDNTYVGPSFQYRPLPRMHIDFTPLIGITHESPAAQIYLILGFEF